MALRRPAPLSAVLLSRPSTHTAGRQFVCASRTPLIQSRSVVQNPHGTIQRQERAIPKPTPFVPDVRTFLSLIGRKLSQHADKISSWDDLFLLKRQQLKDLGVEPARNRRYLLQWLEKFREGKFGVAGDAAFVGPDGSVEVRLIDMPANESFVRVTDSTVARTPKTRPVVVNVPSTAPQGQADSEGTEEEAAPVDPSEQEKLKREKQKAAGRLRLPELDQQTLQSTKRLAAIKYKQGRGIVGSHAKRVAGTNGMVAVILPKEGLWEDTRGKKVNGGERRRAEVLHKQRATERRAGRA